jgi:hypothetical protein
MHMNRSQLIATYDSLERWYNSHPHHERIYLLLSGCLIIFFSCYLLLGRPIAQQRNVLAYQIQSLKKQTKIFERQIDIVMEEKGNEPQKQTLYIEPSPIKLATPAEHDQIIKAILNQPQKIKLINLKKSVAETKGIEITFTSDYFDTIAYLDQLEKLPWCLSWDSLEYNVINYPVAKIVVNFHIAEKLILFIMADFINKIVFLIIIIGICPVSYAVILDPTRPPTVIGSSSTDSLTLSAIMISQDVKLAVINGIIVHEGEQFNGFKVITITKNSVDLLGSEGKQTLMLLKSVIIPISIKRVPMKAD